MSMELKSLFLKFDRLSPPNCVSVSDPDEKEISDNDDNDRNHKHRRRETMSHALERDTLEQTLTQPYRKRNWAFENEQSGSKFHHNLDIDFSKFEKRRNAGVNFSRFFGEHGSGRGRGRNFQRDTRFGSFDVASQMILPGSIQPAMFAARGLPNVSNAQSAPWSGFGLLPAIPNGPIDAVNPLGSAGMFRPQLNPLFNMDVQRQHCRDFEERGFCLRGDMCPMEHGVNHIVVDDVQSLSQFNLPVSLSCGHGLGKSTGSGFVIPSLGVSSGILMNNQVLHSRTSMFAVDDESLVGAANASGADVYDPDQPLWSSDGHETSNLLRFQPIHFDESDPSVDTDLSDHIIRSSGRYMGSQSTSSSVRGQITHSKNKMELNENFNSKIKPSEYPESKSEETCEAPSVSQGTSQLAKQNNGGSFGAKVAGLTFKVQSDEGAKVRKPFQKAQRTLFVNCIPLKDNNKENLLAHFRKFGKVIDIYIPLNSDRAFVQFSNREEAEKALKAPDAVMGSRFIKLWWANRDTVRVPDEGTNSGNNVTMSLGMPHVTGTNKGKNILQHAASKPPNGLVTAGNDLKPVTANSPKTPPSALKRMENLEVLKELRKKQEMLEQKCYAFYQELEDKLAKQATGVKGKVSSGHPATKQKVGTSADGPKNANPNSVDSDVSGQSLQVDLAVDKMVTVENLTSLRFRTNSTGAQLVSPNLKHAVRPMAISETSFAKNRYKLDNRPTTFRICAPLPFYLANVAALKEHFSVHGAVSNVEIDDSDEEECLKGHEDSKAMKMCTARVSFATRHAAERAFLKGKSWNGYNLQFTWVRSSTSTTSRSSGESSSALKGTLNAEVQSKDKTKHDKSQSGSNFKESDSSPCKSLNELTDESKRIPFLKFNPQIDQQAVNP